LAKNLLHQHEVHSATDLPKLQKKEDVCKMSSNGQKNYFTLPHALDKSNINIH